MDKLSFLRAPTVSNGPFAFAEWKSGQYIRFTRNTKYWKTPYFEEVVFSIYPDTNVMEQLLASGEADFALEIPFLQALAMTNKHTNLQFEAPFVGKRMELDLNQGPTGFAALKDVNVRKAIAMGLDRQTIVDTLYEGKSKVPRSFWDDTPWYNKDTPFISLDRTGAMALLKQAGWYDADGDGVIEAHNVKGVADGTPFVLKGSTYAGDAWTEYQDLLLAVQDQLKKIGIRVDITLFDVNVMHTSLKDGGRYTSGAADLFIISLQTGVESINQYRLIYACSEIPTDSYPSGLNGTHICNPEMDKLWDVLGTSMKAEERQGAVNQIQVIMSSQVLNIYLANIPNLFVFNKNLKGFAWGGSSHPLVSFADLKRS